eukprot:TRINITY_DN27519_c0_g1_i2.p1 TRINITY_DN27519_c0_g1~~TRINITY_DN27519_c0_g1_i2.p1  ORF type:complete len:1005 (+),score=125.90 TRINITY_DN27519_c0_g1_i2:30-3044(+)
MVTVGEIIERVKQPQAPLNSLLLDLERLAGSSIDPPELSSLYSCLTDILESQTDEEVTLLVHRVLCVFPFQPPGIFEVEQIIDSRIHEGKRQFLVKWRGFDRKQSTWEPEENIPAQLSEAYLETGKETNFTDCDAAESDVQFEDPAGLLCALLRSLVNSAQRISTQGICESLLVTLETLLSRSVNCVRRRAVCWIGFALTCVEGPCSHVAARLLSHLAQTQRPGPDLLQELSGLLQLLITTTKCAHNPTVDGALWRLACWALSDEDLCKVVQEAETGLAEARIFAELLAKSAPVVKLVVIKLESNLDFPEAVMGEIWAAVFDAALRLQDREILNHLRIAAAKFTALQWEAFCARPATQPGNPAFLASAVDFYLDILDSCTSVVGPTSFVITLWKSLLCLIADNSTESHVPTQLMFAVVDKAAKLAGSNIVLLSRLLASLLEALPQNLLHSTGTYHAARVSPILHLLTTTLQCAISCKNQVEIIQSADLVICNVFDKTAKIAVRLNVSYFIFDLLERADGSPDGKTLACLWAVIVRALVRSINQDSPSQSSDSKPFSVLYTFLDKRKNAAPLLRALIFPLALLVDKGRCSPPFNLESLAPPKTPKTGLILSPATPASDSSQLLLSNDSCSSWGTESTSIPYIVASAWRKLCALLSVACSGHSTSVNHNHFSFTCDASSAFLWFLQNGNCLKDLSKLSYCDIAEDCHNSAADLTQAATDFLAFSSYTVVASSHLKSFIEDDLFALELHPEISTEALAGPTVVQATRLVCHVLQLVDQLAPSGLPKATVEAARWISAAGAIIIRSLCSVAAKDWAMLAQKIHTLGNLVPAMLSVLRAFEAVPLASVQLRFVASSVESLLESIANQFVSLITAETVFWNSTESRQASAGRIGPVLVSLAPVVELCVKAESTTLVQRASTLSARVVQSVAPLGELIVIPGAIGSMQPSSQQLPLQSANKNTFLVSPKKEPKRKRDVGNSPPPKRLPRSESPTRASLIPTHLAVGPSGTH